MNEKLQQIQDTMALDGYTLTVGEDGGMHVATIVANDGICDDCLVPKKVMTVLLSKALDVAPETIALNYPADYQETHPVS